MPMILKIAIKEEFALLYFMFNEMAEGLIFFFSPEIFVLIILCSYVVALHLLVPVTIIRKQHFY